MWISRNTILQLNVIRLCFEIYLAFLQGVPLRIEIGPRDVSTGTEVISRRDIPGKQGKDFGISMDSFILIAYVKGLLDEIQSCLPERQPLQFMSFFFWEF